MESLNFFQVLLIAFIPALMGAIITYLINSHELRKYKADSMAERTARHFLKHKGYTDRKFETIKKYLGGWDNDEDGLRRLLVRAGAIRSFRTEKGKSIEYWTLLKRMPEKIDKLKQKSVDKE